MLRIFSAGVGIFECDELGAQHGRRPLAMSGTRGVDLKAVLFPKYIDLAYFNMIDLLMFFPSCLPFASSPVEFMYDHIILNSEPHSAPTAVCTYTVL